MTDESLHGVLIGVAFPVLPPTKNWSNSSRTDDMSAINPFALMCKDLITSVDTELVANKAIFVKGVGRPALRFSFKKASSCFECRFLALPFVISEQSRAADRSSIPLSHTHLSAAPGMGDGRLCIRKPFVPEAANGVSIESESSGAACFTLLLRSKLPKL